MSSKRCFRCGEVKLISEFYRHPMMRDGHLGKCKPCTRADVSAHRAENIDRIRAYDRARGWRYTESSKVWRNDYPERRAAQVDVGNAVRDGRLVKQPCLICGGKPEAHHPDYSKPLDVVWLCRAHHLQAHAMVRRA